jgi:hypothetical protein
VLPDLPDGLRADLEPAVLLVLGVLLDDVHFVISRRPPAVVIGLGHVRAATGHGC